MKTICLTEIRIPGNRQRQEFEPGSLNELRESIEQRGLFNPVTCREGPDGLTLVAGERRLRAIQDLHDLGGTFNHDGITVPTGHIPFVTLGDLSELEAEEAELEENVRRIDLTWQERATATARLASLRSRQAAAAGAAAPAVASLAQEIRGSSEGIHHETTRRELIVARHLDRPEVAAAKSVDEAFKLLRRQEQTQRDAALAVEVGKTFTAAAHQAFHADAVEWLAAQPAEVYDVICTDPPFGMGADEFGDSGGRAAGAHSYKDDEDTFQRCWQALVQHAGRITKPQAHIYVFCDIERFLVMREELAAAGWNCFRTPIVWHKPNGNRAPLPEYGPQRKYELCLYAFKGKRPVTKLYPDLVTYQPDPNLGHEAQKPVALFEDLLRRSVHPGDTVLDPFAGSGTIFPAAHLLKCRATGVELDAAKYGICLRRLESLSVQADIQL